jgi:hypothetical protein
VRMNCWLALSAGALFASALVWAAAASPFHDAPAFRSQHKFFVHRFVPEYFQSSFEGHGDALRFVGGTLSPESLAQFKGSLERLAAEFEELARHDARLALERRNGCSAVLAVRSWEFSEFTRLRRGVSSRVAAAR